MIMQTKQDNNGLTLNDRTWTCSECGATHDRDVLAANNIKKFAFRDLKNSGQELSGELVEELAVVNPEKQEAKPFKMKEVSSWLKEQD